MNKFIYFPDVRQNTNYDCGAVCVQAVLAYYGIEYSEPRLQKDLKTSKKWGTTTRNIINFFKYKNFQVESGSFTEKQLKKFIKRKIPVLVLIQAWAPCGTDYRHTNQYGHYVVISGYNDSGFIIEDPAIFGRGIITYSGMKKRWHADDGGLLQNFGIAVWGMKPYDYSKFYPIG
jgi:predicted double-glycine peptidase